MVNRKTRVSITVLLVTAIGGLVAVAVSAVLLLSAYANFKNTSELVQASASSFMESLEADVIAHMTPASQVVEFLAHQAELGELDPALKHETVLLLSGTLGASPQLSDIAVWQPDANEIVVFRDDQTQLVVETKRNDNLISLHEYLAWLRAGRELVWNEPIRVEGSSLISAAAPLFYQEEYLGAVAAGVSVVELSALVESLGKAYGIEGFIIHGKQHLLAHPELPALSAAALDEQNPLHRIEALNNGIISGYADAEKEFAGPNGNLEVRIVEDNGKEFLVLTRELFGFGEVPWTIGAYSPIGDWDTQFKRLMRSIIGGLILLIAAIGAAVWLSGRVARPIRDTAEATLKIGNLDLDKIETLPSSRITELNNQANAFNQMLDALKWFETYVPKQLVRRLIQQQDADAVVSRELELTVMFTDIVGFTASSETKDPARIATELNQHFEILNRCIEAEGGTLDKYIGDAVMAFWGAPERQDDHAVRACNAALRIEQALAESGHDQHIKIAIHTGPLIVGNIGASGRMNYTVIGDTVNTCSRIENLAGTLGSDAQTTILVSDETARHLGDAFQLTKAVEFEVKGRRQPVVTYRLTGR